MLRSQDSGWNLLGDYEWTIVWKL